MTAKRGIVPRGATPLDRALRRIRDRSPLIERVSAWPPVGRLAATILVSAHVRERFRFIARELLGSRGLAQYRLRDSGLRVSLRHGAPDVQNFDEIFYQGLYSPPQRILDALSGSTTKVADLGANIGLAGAYFLGKLTGGSVIAFEPDPANAAVHERTLQANGLGDRWQLIRACAAVEDGELPFAAGAFAESHVLEEHADGAPLLPALDVFPYLQEADLVKMDIEGAEWPILLDERFAQLSARVVVLEYHTRMCPEADSRRLAERVLSDAGYELEPIFHDSDGTGMLWAWREAR